MKIEELCIIALTCMVALLILCQPVSNDNVSVSIEKQLNSNGWTLYTLSSCPACQLQKEMFDINELNMIECDLSKEATIKCIEAKITHVPSWINTITGEMRIGYQEMSQIETMIEND